MKRFRVFSQDFDFTGNYLQLEIMNEWDDEVKESHRLNHQRMIEQLTLQYGERWIEEKLENLRDIGGTPLSIVAYHNRFYRQAREAFIVGAYFPALTAACALGERILNHLVLELRDEYQDQPEYSEFATIKSCSNWGTMIRALESWEVLRPEAATEFRALMRIRHSSLHFNPKVVEKDREMGLIALKHLDKIITIQFAAFGSNPWFIDVPGVAFIRKDWEEHPFIRHVYLPKCGKVGPHHWIADLDHVNGIWRVEDEGNYEDREITDEEFIQEYEAFTTKRLETLAESN